MSFLRKQTGLARHRRPPEPTDHATPSLSYYSRRSEEALNTGRDLRREASKRHAGVFMRFWLRRFGLATLLLTAIICLIDVLSLSTSPRVVLLTNSSSFIHTSADYQAAAAKLLAGSLLNRNKITVDTARIENQLQREFPELTGVSVTLPLLSHRPIVYLWPSAPALIMSSSSGTYVLDSNGKALVAATNSPGLTQLNLPLVTDQSGLNVAPNRQVLPSSDVSFIQVIVAQLAARHDTVTSMTLPAAASELDVHIASQPYLIKFNLQSGDARQQAGSFLAVQTRLQSQQITPAQYIDVRVDGRAYYK